MLILMSTLITLTSCEKEQLNLDTPESQFTTQNEFRSSHTGSGYTYPAGAMFIGWEMCLANNPQKMQVHASDVDGIAIIENLLGANHEVPVEWCGAQMDVPPFELDGNLYSGSGYYTGAGFEIELEFVGQDLDGVPYEGTCFISAEQI